MESLNLPIFEKEILKLFHANSFLGKLLVVTENQYFQHVQLF